MKSGPHFNALPAAFTMAQLEQNLEALAHRQPKLVQRISWPVDGSHVIFNRDQTIQYRLNMSLYPLTLSAEAVAGSMKTLDPTCPIFLFGIGLGEMVQALIQAFPEQKILAWEKDPWLLRLFLMNRNCSEALRRGNLHLLLGTDLISHLPEWDSVNLLFHPFLKNVYHHETVLIKTGIVPKRVLLNTNGLFTDQVSKSFIDLGYTPFIQDLNVISPEETEYGIIQFMPQIIFSINYQNGLAELCRRFNLPLLCWEIDPFVDSISSQSKDHRNVHIFTHRKKLRDEFLQAGFTHAEYLPMAADPESRSPQTVSQEEKKIYSAPVAFAGVILLEQAQKYKKTLEDLYREYCAINNLEPPREPFADILALQADDYATYRLPELFEQHFGDFKKYFFKKASHSIDPVKLLAETAAADKRLRYIKFLAGFNVKIWGDEGWRTCAGPGIQYMGLAGHRFALNKIYSQALINLDIKRLYQPDVVNMRIFDAMACGGFVLAEYSPELEELFQLEQEVAAYRSINDLSEKVQYYLSHEEERRAIALRGRRAVLAKHTIRARVEHMLEAVKKSERKDH